MAGASGHSEACCNTPTVAHEYTPKGKYIEIDGTKTYTVGPANADRAIFVIFDIFGYYPQTLQGADIMAYTDDEQHQYQVFMPDFFNGQPADLSWHPPDTKEKEEKLGKFFQTTANPAEAVKRVPALVEAINKQTGGTIKKWGLVGFCWGGKISALSTTKGTPFSAAAVAHPAMTDPKEAPAIVVPYAILPSKDENMDDIRAFEKALTVPSLLEEYSDMPHGFLTARGELKEAEGKKSFEKGYKTILDFFHKHI